MSSFYFFWRRRHDRLPPKSVTQGTFVYNLELYYYVIIDDLFYLPFHLTPEIFSLFFDRNLLNTFNLLPTLVSDFHRIIIIFDDRFFVDRNQNLFILSNSSSLSPIFPKTEWIIRDRISINKSSRITWEPVSSQTRHFTGGIELESVYF